MPWLLTSRDRPQACQEMLDACVETGMTTPGIVMIDSRKDSYPKLKVNSNWLPIRSPMNLADCMQWVFKYYPTAPFYGWLSDDMRPRTEEWDVKLIEAAGDWSVGCCRDMHLSENSAVRDGVLPGAQCWGGELIRAAGRWALPPKCRMAGLDDAWMAMIRSGAGIKRVYLEDVVVEHLSWRIGMREKDEGDMRFREGDPDFDLDEDIQEFHRWRGEGVPEIAKRIKEAIKKAGRK